MEGSRRTQPGALGKPGTHTKREVADMAGQRGDESGEGPPQEAKERHGFITRRVGPYPGSSYVLEMFPKEITTTRNASIKMLITVAMISCSFKEFS